MENTNSYKLKSSRKRSSTSKTKVPAIKQAKSPSKTGQCPCRHNSKTEKAHIAQLEECLLQATAVEKSLMEYEDRLKEYEANLGLSVSNLKYEKENLENKMRTIKLSVTELHALVTATFNMITQGISEDDSATGST